MISVSSRWCPPPSDRPMVPAALGPADQSGGETAPAGSGSIATPAGGRRWIDHNPSRRTAFPPRMAARSSSVSSIALMLSIIFGMLPIWWG